MALPSVVQNARKRTLTITWKDDDGNPIDLTGAVLYAIKWDADNVESSITGTLTISNAAAGIFTWATSAADVATAGTYYVQFGAKYPTGTYEISYRTQWRVFEAFHFAFISPSLSPSASVSPSPSASPS